MSKAEPFAPPVVPVVPVRAGELRPLKWDEPVLRGDFVRDESLGFKPWEGPSGFRADAFVTQIYRRLGQPPVKAKRET
jgi:hypothetical protein